MAPIHRFPSDRRVLFGPPVLVLLAAVSVCVDGSGTTSTTQSNAQHHQSAGDYLKHQAVAAAEQFVMPAGSRHLF
eukprot:COSAG02_NODE_35363_length_469_cov_1.113514_1_plen_74_part_01